MLLQGFFLFPGGLDLKKLKCLFVTPFFSQSLQDYQMNPETWVEGFLWWLNNNSNKCIEIYIYIIFDAMTIGCVNLPKHLKYMQLVSEG